MKGNQGETRFGLQLSSELLAPFAGRKGLFPAILGMSAALNILLLSGSLFMLLVYDEVLASRSTPSLLGLLVLLLIAFAFQAAIEHLRNRIAANAGDVFDAAISNRVFALSLEAELRGNERSDAAQPVRDLDTVRAFLSSQAPMAILDLPWVLLFLGILFAFHYLLGLVSLAGALLLVCMTWYTDKATAKQVESATQSGSARISYADTTRRNAEVIRALGMTGSVTSGWEGISSSYTRTSNVVSEKLSALRTFSKTFRLLLQSLILACGAWLVINDAATGGVIIASSILASRALAPIDQAIGNWRAIVSAKQAWNRLAQRLAASPRQADRIALPRPERELAVSHLSAAVAASKTVLFHDVSFTLSAGDALAIIGPSGSGKSSLSRALVGILPTAQGSVRLDGAALDQWPTEVAGRFIGYLPQDIELFDGTIARNIARLDPAASSEDIIHAAKAAGVHDLVVAMPEGYDTVIGPNGRNLSAGQRQRIALARALFGDPFLIVLDEPNSNLDADGDAALGQAIAQARQRGAITILVAHRPSALAEIGHVLWLEGGRVRACGPKTEVLAAVSGSAPPSGARIRAVGDT
jgi:PrtD family type I secretion system ABC transporter